MKHIVKRKGHKEKYDERKLYASVYSASLNCHLTKEGAEKIAEKAVKKINIWIEKKAVVDSNQLFEETANVLKNIDQEVSFMFKTHRDLS